MITKYLRMRNKDKQSVVNTDRIGKEDKLMH